MGLRSFADCTSCVQASEGQRRWRTQSRQSGEGAERGGSLLQSATGKEAVSVSDWPACFHKRVPCCAACLGNPSVVRLITLLLHETETFRRQSGIQDLCKQPGQKLLEGSACHPLLPLPGPCTSVLTGNLPLMGCSFIKALETQDFNVPIYCLRQF